MDENSLLETIREKDRIIANLNDKIADLSGKVAELSNKIGELVEIQKSNANNGILTTGGNNKTRERPTKRHNDQNLTFKRPKTGKIDNYFATTSDSTVQNMDGVEILCENSTTQNKSNNDDADVTHNLTSENNVANENTEGISWAEMAYDAGNRKNKPTPIQLGSVKDGDFGLILKLLREKFDVSEFEWIQLRKTVHPRIVCINETVKDKITSFLLEKDIEFNTYAEKNSKKTAFIVRGMQYDSDNDNIAAIRDTLIDFNITSVQTINKFQTPSMKRAENPNSLYQIVCAPNSDFSNIEHIKTMDGFRVKIEKLIGSKTTQCRRCQRFTHVASSCHFKYRCVQCIQTHGPGNCPRANNKKLPIGCVNCAEAGLAHNNHTANDLVHCGYYQQTQQRKNNTSKSGILTQKSGKHSRSSVLHGNTQSGTLGTATLDDPHNIANNNQLSKRKTKRLIQQYRPTVTTGKSNRNKTSENQNKTSSKPGLFSNINKNELFNFVEQCFELWIRR